MSEESTPQQNDKFNLVHKASAIIVLAFLLFTWLCDRLIHLLLWHKTHEKFSEWTRGKETRKQAFARVIIFAIPIIIFKLIF